MAEAIERTGLSDNTLRRRVDAWIEGKRTPYAIKGGRTGGDRGDRQFDALDVERARLQLLGELDGSVTTDEYAAMVAAREQPST